MLRVRLHVARRRPRQDDFGCATRREHLFICVYLPGRWSNRPVTRAVAQDVVAVAYWLRQPGPNATVLSPTKVWSPEAIAATGLLAEDRRDFGLLAFIWANTLKAGLQAAERAR